MKKVIDIISIAIVSVLLMFVLKKAIKLGSTKPEKTPTEEQVAEQAPQPASQEETEHLETQSFDKPAMGGGEDIGKSGINSIKGADKFQ